MPQLSVPEQHAKGFQHILGLSEEEAQAVAKALESATTASPRELTGLVVRAMPNMSIGSAREMVEALRSLYNARTSIDATVESFVSDLIRAVQVSSDDGSAAERLSITLRALLSIRRLSMISKARTLHIDHDRIFCSAKVLTDMRPVFDINIEEEPSGFVVVHVLKLGYHHHGSHDEIYIAMDKVDVQDLIDKLARAQRKATTLSDLAGEKGLSILAE